MVVEGGGPSRRRSASSQSSRRRPPTSPSHAKTILLKTQVLAAPTSSLTDDHPTPPPRQSQPHAMVVVESILQSAVEVVKTSFTSPCACASGDSRHKQKRQQEEGAAQKSGNGGASKAKIAGVTGVSTASFRRPNKFMPLSAITSSTFSVDSCDDTNNLCDDNGSADGGSYLASPTALSVGNPEAVAAAESRLAEAERRLAAAISCEKRYQHRESEEEESRDQSMDDPRQQQQQQRHMSNRRKGQEDGRNRTDATSAGYGLVPEQITFEIKTARTNQLADSCPKKSKGGSDRPPIAKPPISKTMGVAHGGGNHTSRGDHERIPSDGSGESFIQGEALLSTSGDDNHGNIRHHCASTTDGAYHVSVLTSYSSASEATTDDANASTNKDRAEPSSLPRTPIRDALTVATTASPHDTPPEPSSPVVPFSPGAHSSCTNPSYFSSSSEDDDDDDLFDVESLQGDLYKIAQMQRSQHHRQVEPMHHQHSPDASPQEVADVTITTSVASNDEGAEHEEYNIQEGDSREWLRLDSLTGDGRPTLDIHTASDEDHPASPSTGKYEGDQERPLASSSQRFFSEQSSSLSLDVIEIATSPRSESTRGGLASLDAILMASSSLSVYSDDDDMLSEDDEEVVRVRLSTSTQSEISESLRSALEELQTHDDDDDDSFNYGSALKDGEEDVPKMDPEGEILKYASVDTEEAEHETDCLVVSAPPSTVEGEGQTVIDETITTLEDQGMTLSDLSSERAPVGSLASVHSLDPTTTTIEGCMRERAHFIMLELEQEYQERVEGMKRQYSAKLQRLRRQLDIQLEHDLQEQMHRVGIGRCTGAESTQQTSSQKCLQVDTSGAHYAVMTDETRSIQSTQSTPKLTGAMNLIVSQSKKKRKEAMEERLQSLMLRLNTSAASTRTALSKCPGDLSTTETTPQDDNGNKSRNRTAGDDLNFDVSSASETASRQTKDSATFLTNDTAARTTLMSITKVYESQQNWLLVDLEHDAEDKAALLHVIYHCIIKKMEELEALETQNHIKKKEFKEERAEAENRCKVRIAGAKAEVQQVQDDNEELCASLNYDIGREENSIKDLVSRLEETQKHNATLEMEVNEQTHRIGFLRSESVEVQERLKKLTMILDQQGDEHKIQLEREKERTNNTVAEVRAEVSAAIERQFEEGDKKKEALTETQQKVTERLAALQKLLAITESSKATSSHEWNVKELELTDECKHLEQSTILTEERKANKGVAFARVVNQLNDSYQSLSKTIDASRNVVEASQRQTEEMKCEISQLKRDNEQVSSWISELDAVLRSMGKDVPFRR